MDRGTRAERADQGIRIQTEVEARRAPASTRGRATVAIEHEGRQPQLRRQPGAPRHHHGHRRASMVTAFIGPSGCGKSTLLRCLNRMNDLIDGVHDQGRHPRERAGHLRARPTSSRCGGAWGWCSRSRTRSRSRSTRTSSTGCASTASDKRDARRGVRAQLARRGAVGRSERPPERERARPLGRPAAATLHRARHRRRAGDHADGRALLGARPDRHPEDRGAHLHATF